jgi:hypothetical protein
MRQLSAVAALVAGLQSGVVAAAPLFICLPRDLSATEAASRGGVILVRGGGMGGGGGGMRPGGGGMCCAAGGGMGGMGGFGAFGFHRTDCSERRAKSASRHAESKLSSCSN